MSDKKLTKEELLKKANGWVYEAQWAAREWRSESWRDCEMFDGGAASWSDADYIKAQEAGIDPLTVNRTFPAVNMIIGSQSINRLDIVAKGRTKEDSEIGQVVSEGIKFIFDQCQGEYLISQAFSNAVIPGFGCIAPCVDPDPRNEKLSLRTRDWKEVWWDPYSSPWWNPYRTRYVFWQRWLDLEDFKAIFQEKSKDIDRAYDELCGDYKHSGTSSLMDEGQMVEEHIKTLASSDWIDTGRKRIRPVEMWYSVDELCMFALFPDGRCYEIHNDMDPRQAYQIIQQSQQVLKTMVKKIRVMTFFGEHLLLQDIPSPYHHNQYPLIPFLGYVDRYGFPYGIPRQIRGQNEEVNKRRSMALAMLQKRRVIAERGVVPNGDQDALNNLYTEANKLDGFMVVEDGKLGAFNLDELANLAAPQMELLRQSELEIREIAGTNSEAMGYDSGAESGIAKQLQIQRSQVTTASLFDNLRRSMKLLGDQVTANMQQFWTFEKVLRITNRLTGAEKFVSVNQPIKGADGIEIKNDITQGKFDIVISEVQVSDTMREKNMELLYAAIEKSPPQAMPTILMAAFEISDLPNKEILIQKLKPILDLDPSEDDIDPEEMKQKVLQQVAAQKEHAALMDQVQMESLRLELNEKKLKNAELEAKILKLMADTSKTNLETQVTTETHKAAMDQAAAQNFMTQLQIVNEALLNSQLQSGGQAQNGGQVDGGQVRGEGGENAQGIPGISERQGFPMLQGAGQNGYQQQPVQ